MQLIVPIFLFLLKIGSLKSNYDIIYVTYVAYLFFFLTKTRRNKTEKSTALNYTVLDTILPTVTQQPWRQS